MQPLQHTEKQKRTSELPRSGKHTPFRRCLLLLYSVACGLAMMVQGGATFTQLYAPSPYHRLQADAFLKGKLHLGDSVQQIAHDLAWYNGQVNHLWGLGVGLWLTPFEAVWRLLGQKWFPDRVALGVAFALLAWYSGHTAWAIAERLKRPALGIGLTWLITLCPALWTLNQGPRLIYEETSLYACLVSLGILMALVCVACFGQPRDLFICAALAALSALVRPTHGIYGLAGMLTCSAIFLVRRCSVRTILCANGIFAAGLIFLALTNWSRFGLPTEFGHNLSVTPGIIVFMTRMGNPMRQASFSEAGRELFSTLFLMRNLKNQPDDLVRGQAPYERWRDPYLSTFDLSCAVVCALAIAGAIVWIWRKRRAGWQALMYLHRPGGALFLATLAWSGLSSGALFVFYLRFPNFSFRYLLDFAPAFTGFALLLWLLLPKRFSWFALNALAVWLGYEVLTSQVRSAPVPLLARDKIPTDLVRMEGRRIAEFDGSYDATNHPAKTAIAYNGNGWAEEDGRAESIVILALDRPDFVELLVGPRETAGARPARIDVYRAKMDNQFLPLRSVQPDGQYLRVYFEVPEQLRRRRQDELVFLCFSHGYDVEDRDSTRALFCVRWRRTQPPPE